MSGSRSASIGSGRRGWSGSGFRSVGLGSASASGGVIGFVYGFAMRGRVRSAGRLWWMRAGLRCAAMCGWVRCARASQQRERCRCVSIALQRL